MIYLLGSAQCAAVAEHQNLGHDLQLNIFARQDRGIHDRSYDRALLNPL